MKDSRPIPRALAIALIAVSTASISTSIGRAEEGPSDIARELLTGETVGLELLWRRPLGTGYSGIAISGELGATLYGDGSEDRLVVFEVASGETLWEAGLGPTYRGHHGSDDGPLSTPAIAGDTVYALSPHGRLVAHRLVDGELLWERQIDPAAAPEYGFSTSPLVRDGLLVLQVAGATGRSLTAFRLEDGEELWSAGDEPAAYENPTWAPFAGTPQLIASDHRWLFGVEPETGRRLWRLEHVLGNDIGLSRPLLSGGTSILINSLDGAALFDVAPTGETWRAVERWRTDTFKRSYTVPVVDQGYAYGFSGRFLVAVDLGTGEAVWRSREPGGGNLTLVASHLAILARDGRLVLARATPDGFERRAERQALADGGVTAPAFADSVFYVRNLTEMSAVRLVPFDTASQTTEEATGAAAPRGEIERLAARVEASTDRRAVVDEFLSAQETFPIVEGEGQVHFVYRGDAEGVALKGSVIGFDPSNELDMPLERLPDTDLWYVTLDLHPEGHWEYVFDVDFGNEITDPLNPHTIGSIFGEVSELRMPGWIPPDHIEPSSGATGRLETLELPEQIFGEPREVRVYLPAGYDTGSSTYPLLLVYNGFLALDEGRLQNSLDNLVGDRVEPLVAVFLRRSRDELGGPRTADFASEVASRLVPYLEHRYRLRQDPGSRGVVGVGSGGFAAAYAVAHHPEVFGRLGVQSTYFPVPELADALLEATTVHDLHPLVAYVEWSRFDVQLERLGVDAIAQSRLLAEALEAAGASVGRNEVIGAPGWASWRAQSDEMLEWLFPLDHP